jgi:hypothetical protein
MIITDIDKIANLPSPPLGFLGALHDSSAVLYTGTSLPPAEDEPNQVFLVSAPVTAPAFASWPAQAIPANTHVGSDGKRWYPVTRYKNTNTYHPSVFNRTLYTIPFTPTSLPLQGVFNLQRVFSFRLFANTSDVVWNVVWELGDRTTETAPAPTGPNLKDYNFREPLLDEQIPITDVMSRNTFAISLRKVNYTDAGMPEYSCIIERFGRQLSAGTAQLPLTENFVLRLRLAAFDTLDNVAEPRGYVAYEVSASS